jgi:diadenosine tetraphosphate (Ap4A) HIT family hydrolase
MGSRIYSNLIRQKRREKLKFVNPVTDGHLLILPKRHMEDYFSLNETEKKDIGVLIMKLKNRIINSQRKPSSFL